MQNKIKNRRRNMLFLLLLFIVLLCGCGKKNEELYNTAEIIEESDVNLDIEEETSEKNSDTVSVNNSDIISVNNVSENNNADDKKQVQLIMVGDVLLHTPVSESGKREDGTYNYDAIFAHTTSLIGNADIAMANQEVILGGTALGLTGYPSFNGAFEVGDALSKAGFDVICHATNHALDRGEKAVRNCLSFWAENHPEMTIVGINESSEKQNEITIVEKQGIKIAILNYTYGTNGISLPTGAPYLVNMLDKEKIAEDVMRARELADFIIVCPHWGIEYHHEESDGQREWAEYLASLGVNLIIGTHPHVIEPVEWVSAENGNKALVYYSLGNFVNSTSDYGDGIADRMLGAMASVKLERNENGAVDIVSYDSIPLVSHLEPGFGGITVYPLEEYTRELAERNEIIKQDSNFTTEYLWNVWNEVMKK